MNIAILSKGETLYSTQSLLKAGAKRKHVMEVLDPSHCSLSIENGKSVVRFHDEIVDDLDAIIPRIGASNTYYGATLVRHFNAMNVFSVVSAEAILQTRDKWTCSQLLSTFNVPIPKTILGSSSNLEYLLSNFKNEPVIIKILEGTHGNGVILADTYLSALSTIETLKTAGVKFLLQEYIKESKGTDLRVIVVGGKVVSAMKRQSKEGDFRSNLHRGGSSAKINLSYEEENIALRAAKAMKLGVCGIDILQSSRGPLVLEINSSPGLEGIEKTTEVNISEKIISYIERNKR
jgi:ribosomal protein S6--L-glutamate ligase